MCLIKETCILCSDGGPPGMFLRTIVLSAYIYKITRMCLLIIYCSLLYIIIGYYLSILFFFKFCASEINCVTMYIDVLKKLY